MSLPELGKDFFPLTREVVFWEFDYDVDGVLYKGHARQSDNSWGKGVSVEIRTAEGERRSSFSFHCHPEFDDFADCQRRSVEERVARAIGLLRTEEMKKYTREPCGLGLIQTFQFGKGEWLGPIK